MGWNTAALRQPQDTLDVAEAALRLSHCIIALLHVPRNCCTAVCQTKNKKEGHHVQTTKQHNPQCWPCAFQNCVLDSLSVSCWIMGLWELQAWVLSRQSCIQHPTTKQGKTQKSSNFNLRYYALILPILLTGTLWWRKNNLNQLQITFSEDTEILTVVIPETCRLIFCSIWQQM